MILVPTIRHTGSHFVVDELLFDYEQRPLKTPGQGKGIVVMDHVIWSKTAKLQQLAETAEAVIIPLRHPRVVAYSWMQRGFELWPDFSQMWNDIWKFEDICEPLYLTLDNEDIRDEQLAAIADKLGRTLSTNWPEIGPNAAVRSESLSDMMLLSEADRVNELVDRHWERLKRFYGEPEAEAAAEEETPESASEEAPKEKAPKKKAPAKRK